MMSTFDLQMEPSKFTHSCVKEIALFWKSWVFHLVEGFIYVVHNDRCRCWLTFIHNEAFPSKRSFFLGEQKVP